MLWIPGPTEVRPEIFEELCRPMIGHRSAKMVSILERIDPGLRHAFGIGDGSASKVAVGTHSATAMMEGALLGAGPRVLSIVNGAFSRRWSEIAELLGKDVSAVEVDLGHAVSEEALETALAAFPADAVTLVVNETSTGVVTSLERVARVLAKFPETMLFVDVVSAIAGMPIGFDERRIDFALAGVNKALALPPGICVMAASERYMEKARGMERRSYYLDPVRTIDGHVSRKTPATPCVPLFAALARQLEDITHGRTLPESERHLEGVAAWDARFAKHSRMRDRTLAWAQGHGIAPFPAREDSSCTVSCLRAGEIDVAAFLTNLSARGHDIGNGYGPLKGETFRIGHMGDHTEQGLESLLSAADECLAS